MRSLFLVLCVAGVALADGDAKLDEAKRDFDAGKAAYEAGQYDVAVTAFEQAYAAVPKPPIVFSLAQSYRKLGLERKDPTLLKKASAKYDEYIKAVPSGGRHDDAVDNKAQVEANLMAMVQAGITAPTVAPATQQKTMIMVYTDTQGATATATVDGQPAAAMPLTREVAAGPHKIHVEAPGFFPADITGTAGDSTLTPIPIELKEQPSALTLRGTTGVDLTIDSRPLGVTSHVDGLAPGKHIVVVQKRGHHPLARELNLERGKTMTLDANLDRTGQRTASYWVFGAAGALAIAGGVTTLLAYSDQSQAEDILTKMKTMNLTDTERAHYTTLVSQRNMMNLASASLYGGAAVVGVTALLLYLVDSPRVEMPQENDNNQIVPTVTPTEMGASFSHRF
jgi:hypothetical protein